jgi:hypothetical protein
MPWSGSHAFGIEVIGWSPWAARKVQGSTDASTLHAAPNA